MKSCRKRTVHKRFATSVPTTLQQNIFFKDTLEVRKNCIVGLNSLTGLENPIGNSLQS